jgi:hypothetical protein
MALAIAEVFGRSAADLLTSVFGDFFRDGAWRGPHKRDSRYNPTCLRKVAHGPAPLNVKAIKQ